MITLCIKAHHIMRQQDTHERRIFRLKLFGYLDCSLDILSFPFEDMLEKVFFTKFSLTLRFVGKSFEGDISFSFKLSCLDMVISSSSKSIISTWSSNLQFLLNGYWILMAGLSNIRIWKLEFSSYLKTKK